MDDLHAGSLALGSGDGTSDLQQPSATEKQQFTSGSSMVEAVHELGTELRDALQLKAENSEIGDDLPSEEDSSSSLDDESITADNDESNPEGSSSTGISSKFLHKCATFPVTVCQDEMTPNSYREDDSLTRSVSLPIARKLVSALKGGREKEGLPPRKLSVSWAPEVYDPAPTSLSHHPKKKVQQTFKTNKKHGKGKQKGKSMRGGGSCPKDKKHYRKIGGKSDRCLDSFADTDRVVSSNNYKSQNYKSSTEILDFEDYDDEYDDDIGIPDSNCGSSFRGKAGGAMHYVYAEAK